MIHIRLNGLSEIKQVQICELRGSDELSVTSVLSASAIVLLNRIISLNTDNGLLENIANRLPVAERDFLLAKVYISTYGDLIESTLTCQTCNKLFDLSFSLNNLVDTIWAEKEEFIKWNNGDGTFNTEEDISFRLPTGDDELVIQHQPSEEAKNNLAQRCSKSFKQIQSEKIEQAISMVAPLIESDLATICPECGLKQTVFFNMQSYLLNTILNERNLIYREIHLIATAYRWSKNDILGLPRSMRKSFVQMILDQYEN